MPDGVLNMTKPGNPPGASASNSRMTKGNGETKPRVVETEYRIGFQADSHHGGHLTIPSYPQRES